MKTDLDDLNEYLLKASQARVGVRRKVVLVERWLRTFKERARKPRITETYQK